MTRLALASAIALMAAGCGPADEPGQAGDAPGAPDAAASAAATPAGQCREPGPLSRTFDASGTPLVFDFPQPADFAVRSTEAPGDGSYKVELVRDTGGSNPATISVMQFPAAGDDPAPPGIPTPEQVERNPALQALADSLPKPAETIGFAGRQVVTYRSVTDTKVAYKFNLPDADGYQTVNVHFYPPAGSDNCVPMMEAFAAQWVTQLVPRQSAPAPVRADSSLPDGFPAAFPMPPGLGDIVGHCNLDGMYPACSAGGTSTTSVADLATFFEQELVQAGYRQVEQQQPVSPGMTHARVTFEGHGCTDECYVRMAAGDGATDVHIKHSIGH